MGSYVCFQALEESEYCNVRFEIGKILELPFELMDDAEVLVQYHEFDKYVLSTCVMYICSNLQMLKLSNICLITLAEQLAILGRL